MGDLLSLTNAIFCNQTQISKSLCKWKISRLRH